MAAIMIDGVSHRMRRGKLVPIPAKWLGRITTKKTIRVRRRVRAMKKAGRNPGGLRPHLRKVGPSPAEWE